MRLVQSNLPVVMSPVWLVFWAGLLSLCWLLPVHFPPWSTFPADSWAAIMSLVATGALVVRRREKLVWHSFPCLVAALALLPWLQFFTGLLPYGGQAWMSSAYLLGLLLTVLVGANWELITPKQLVHGLFLAIGIASVVSVGLQLYTWLGQAEDGALGLWSLGQVGSRPSANLGQPNQLATLLIWGLMACLWAFLHKLLASPSALFTASFLLLGLAMTQSRTGLLAATTLLLAVWFWKRVWPSQKLPFAATGLYFVFLLYAPLLRWLDGALLLGQESIRVRLSQQNEIRFTAWQLFSRAIMERPMFGYGWTEATSAQMAVAEQFPGLGVLFSHSHNLFLDLLLWCGLPVGLMVTVFLIRWFWYKFVSIRQSEDAVLFMLVLAVGIHALLEFPLQYAYFLLPTGLVIGVLNARLGARVIWVSPRWILAGLFLTAALVLGITLRDYAKVDTSYSQLRLEQSLLGQGRPPMGGPPEVWTLTHLREWINMARAKPHAGMSQQALIDIDAIVVSYPSRSSVYQLAVALALNGEPEKARAWLAKLCKFTNVDECMLAKRSWAQDSLNDPRIAAVIWPD